MMNRVGGVRMGNGYHLYALSSESDEGGRGIRGMERCVPEYIICAEINRLKFVQTITNLMYGVSG